MTLSSKNVDLRKSPSQSRSNHTYEAILEASELILGASGLSGFNTNAIAERAGVSVGTLYQYFPGKEAILATLVRNMRSEMRQSLSDAIKTSATGDLENDIGVMIDASLKHHLDHEDIVEILEQAEDTLPLDAETQALKTDIMEMVVKVLENGGVSNPHVAAADLVSVCHALSRSSLASGERSFQAIGQKLRRTVFGYLNISPRQA